MAAPTICVARAIMSIGHPFSAPFQRLTQAAPACKAIAADARFPIVSINYLI
jgi:hypothetical protein